MTDALKASYGHDRHVIPLNDLREHRADLICWCRPQRDEDEPCVIVHNSLDRREVFEKVPVH